MEERVQLDQTYFSLPDGTWSGLDPETYEALIALQLAIGNVIDRFCPLPRVEEHDDKRCRTRSVLEIVPDPISPTQLAQQLHEVAGEIVSDAAGDEQDIRQVITTLRTALAVCWDLYSAHEAETVTVAEHMRNLRERIEDFERDLLALRRQSTND